MTAPTFEHRRALALALDTDLRETTVPAHYGILRDAVDWLDAELNNFGRDPIGSVPGDDSHTRTNTAARLRRAAETLSDTRRGELWQLAADAVEAVTP